MKSGKTFHGIKGPTSLTEMAVHFFVCHPLFDYLVDIPNIQQRTWHISKNKLTILNKRLSQTKPPYDIKRTPRTLETIKYWKASEFRAFALYYFLLLDGILLEPYFSHFANLSYALFQFCYKSPSLLTVSKM